ncbi:ABC transporter permease [uncultured Agathobaculum sp.]|uniref:ABC transporter permease n=1 Tax=uncultured Agathobaculum sp. TaxID=2048140 RepID=UPI00261D4DA7|nr:ABC transporter permease [uncultured Agathobaculum sp.]
MRTFSEVYAALRRKNRGQYGLLAGCCFFSVLLITAYACMMRSPTILTVLPEGGDSRKQVMMVFVLAVIGCAVFTTYAAGLFFRQKSRETGVFLALGASRRQLRNELGFELAVLSLSACAAGAVLGAPLAWCIWQCFRLLLVDSEEMPLAFDPQAYLLALVFSAYVVIMLFLLAARFIRRTNIIDIVQESHKSEPIHVVPHWYGPVGIMLAVCGALLGYLMPSFFVRVLHWYAPGWVDAVFYLPVLIGLYMVLLHTVVNGWRCRKNRYKTIISDAMMKFQGRQTVRNMLVMALLIGGAYFASFYAPMMGSSMAHSYDTRPVDFAYHWRADQDIPQRDEVQRLADEAAVEITAWAQQEAAVLGVDGTYSIETETGFGTTYTTAYAELLNGATFFSERAYNALTGQNIDILSGTCANVLDDEGGSSYLSGGDVTHLTNMTTGKTLDVTPAEPLRYSLLLGCYVLDNVDYTAIAAGLDDIYREKYVFFNVADAENSYTFAKALFDEIVDRSGPEVEVGDYYDDVSAAIAAQKDEPYDFAPKNAAALGLGTIDYADRDSSAFRLYWKYMPQFRVLDKNDFITTMAVFLMLFVFIALVCFAAVIVIAFTRCMTIALTSARVYDDLRHLGAPNAYLFRAVRGQVSRVFVVPALTGTGLIWAFYMIMLYFNGTPYGFTSSELQGMATCAAVVAAISTLLYLVYRLTRRSVCRALHIHT